MDYGFFNWVDGYATEMADYIVAHSYDILHFACKWCICFALFAVIALICLLPDLLAQRKKAEWPTWESSWRPWHTSASAPAADILVRTRQAGKK